MIKMLVTISLSLGFVTACANTAPTQTPNIPIADNETLALSRAKLGIAYLNNNNPTIARENLIKAYSLAPNNLYVLLSFAHYYDVVGDTNSANLSYQSALRSFPEDSYALNNYAAFLCKQEKYTQAQTLFNKALSNSSYLFIAASYENLGLCLLKSGEEIKAKESFERALAYQPDRVISLVQACQIDIKRKNYRSAKAKLKAYQQSFGPQKVTLELLLKLEKLDTTVKN
ncbi:type IV pilus biogenesis/stability protein PilW [Vibrio sp. S4M6]|uniref:type IV pilus biogenesis/stability protein PilW n=1 Tax=Vibrio sinus TaxID=2946865 RepID=UPI00202A62A6|nr:type IV pilus biogenesis/stability protein PilW [Vibrio sinus]MCL9783168.1 type IV pilus biogenesis/stability protein PilW [Vibrio sinus]